MKSAIQVSRLAERVAALRISSDEHPYLDGATAPALAEAVAALRADETVHAVLITGGERHFCAGVARETLLADDGAAALSELLAQVPRLLLSIPVPTVAAMAGHAIGGGFLLGLWCDLAFLAEESLYGVNPISLGFTPGMGALQVLEEALGSPLARELMFTGRIRKGRELGGSLLHGILPRKDVFAGALAAAQEIAEAPREALTLLKSAVAERRREGLEKALLREESMHRLLFARPETKRLISERYAVAKEVDP